MALVMTKGTVSGQQEWKREPQGELGQLGLARFTAWAERNLQIQGLVQENNQQSRGWDMG